MRSLTNITVTDTGMKASSSGSGLSANGTRIAKIAKSNTPATNTNRRCRTVGGSSASEIPSLSEFSGLVTFSLFRCCLARDALACIIHLDERMCGFKILSMALQ